MLLAGVVMLWADVVMFLAGVVMLLADVVMFLASVVMLLADVVMLLADVVMLLANNPARTRRICAAATAAHASTHAPTSVSAHSGAGGGGGGGAVRAARPEGKRPISSRASAGSSYFFWSCTVSSSPRHVRGALLWI